MNQYQAYQDKQESSSIIKDLVISPVSAQAWMYGHMPSMWSGTEGVHVPISMKYAKTVGRAVKEAWGKKRYGAAAGNSLKMLGALRPFGFGGSRVLAFKNYEDQVAHLKEGVSSMTRGKARLEKKIRQMHKPIAQAKKAGLAAKQVWKNRPMARLDLYPSDKAEWVKKGAKWGAEEAKFAKRAAGVHKKIDSLVGHRQTLIKKLNNYKTLSVARGATKFAIRGAKMVSMFGATMFALDMAKMIGEPVGRAIMSEIDMAAQKWNDRFLPEMGGELQMSYLTRGAATERQRALNAMSKSQITGRSGFGQEAKYAHG